MIYLSQNIKNLRKLGKLTQDELALKLGIKRSMLGSYEEGRAIPKPELMLSIASFFGVSTDELLSEDMSVAKALGKVKKPVQNKVLTVVVSPDNQERIAIVPVKASAGYLAGYGDADFIATLPTFSMPIAELSNERTYRVFQIRGDSMLPIQPESYLFCDYVESLSDIKDGKTYVVATTDNGVVYKRVYNQIDMDGCLLMKSDNKAYEPFTVEADSVLEIWRALGCLTFDLPNADAWDIQNLTDTLKQKLI